MNIKPIIDSDNPQIAAILIKLTDLLLKLGAFFHPNLRISYEDDNFSCHCPESLEGEYLIKLPANCLIRVEDYQISLNDMQLQATPVNQKLSADQKELMHLTIQLFNVSNKIRFIRENSIILKLGVDNEIYKHLNDFQSEKGFVKSSKKLYQANKIDELTIQTLLTTRTFHESKTSMGRVIMPIIDFFNHHPRGADFLNKLHKPENSYLSIKAKHADGTSDQCYACYGSIKDSMHLYNIYHYTDTQTPFLFTIPVNTELENFGRIKILRNPLRKKNSKHPLTAALPSNSSYIDGKLTVSDIHISSEGYPGALRLNLSLLLQRLAPTSTSQQLNEAILILEQTILDSNTRYYIKLIDLLPEEKGLPIHQSLKLLAHHQLDIIDQYQLNIDKPRPTSAH